MEALLNMLAGSMNTEGIIEQLNAILQSMDAKLFILLAGTAVMGIIVIISLITIIVLAHRMNILNAKFNELLRK